MSSFPDAAQNAVMLGADGENTCAAALFVAALVAASAAFLGVNDKLDRDLGWLGRGQTAAETCTLVVNSKLFAPHLSPPLTLLL